MKRWRALQSLTIASIKMYFRNVTAVFFTLFIPVMLVVIFGLLNIGGNGPEIKLGLSNHSESALARQLVEQIRTVKAFKIEEGSDDAMRDKLGKGKIDLQVMIPSEFGQETDGRLAPSKVYSYYNQSKLGTGQTAGLILGQIVSGFNARLLNTQPIITLDSSGVKTNDLNAIDFLLPGIIAMSIMQLGIFSVAFGFISYKTTGALRRLQATPVHPIQFIVAQSITRLIIGVVQVCLLLFLGLAFFHMHLIGNLLALLAVASLGTLVFLAFGFMIAGAAHDENQAAPLANLIAFPQLFLAGIFFPSDSFPKWLQVVTSHLPLTYLGDAMRRIANEGVGFTAIQGDLLGLTIWGVLAFIVAVRVFSWE